MMSRLMKHEIIEMADRVENMQTMMETNQIDTNFLLQVVVNKFDQLQKTHQILKEGSCEVSFCPSCMTMSDSNGSLGDGLSDIEKHSEINHTDGNYVDGYSSQRQQFQTLSSNIHESIKSQKDMET